MQAATLLDDQERVLDQVLFLWLFIVFLYLFLVFFPSISARPGSKTSGQDRGTAGDKKDTVCGEQQTV